MRKAQLQITRFPWQESRSLVHVSTICIWTCHNYLKCILLSHSPRQGIFQTKRFDMMCNAWKGRLCNLRTTQALISLRISAGWSGPSLSAYRIRGYGSICRRTETAQIRLHRCRCACWSRPTLSINCIRALFVRWALCDSETSPENSHLWVLTKLSAVDGWLLWEVKYIIDYLEDRRMAVIGRWLLRSDHL